VDGTPLTFADDFTVALWLDVPSDRAGSAGGLARMFDATTRSGFNLGTVSAAGGYDGPGDELRLSFGIDSASQPRWLDYGRPSPTSNYVSNSLTVFDGHLHAATTDAPAVADRAHVYRCHGERQWEDLGQLGAGAAHGVGPLVVHQGALYAATWNIDWTRVETENLEPCRVYRYERPGKWEDCGQPGAARRLYSLASYGGDLYVAGDDRTLQVYAGDRTWEPVRTLPSHAHPMTVHDGSLVLGTLNPASVWTFDGTTWTDLGNPLGGEEHCDQIHTLDGIDGALHLGTWPFGTVVRRDAGSATWQSLGRLGDSTEVQSLASYNGMLYAGAIPRSEVFRYDRGRWTSLQRFYDPPGWAPSPVSEPDDSARAHQGMLEWSRVTSLTEHAGRLFASTGSCTGSAADAPADIRGTVHALSAGVTATTAQPLEPGWHHVTATRRRGDLAIYVDGRAAATAHGDVTGSLTPGTPLQVAGSDLPGGFRGQVHGFDSYDRVLTQREIEALAAHRPL
jgi:Concanavalin A-like lectin/glucanases superfamily